jgi:hypothetical protein
MAGVATGQPVTFSIGASASQTENIFTHIEVYRSRSGEDGPFTEVTGQDWSLPRHVISARSAVLSSRTLEFRVSETHDVTVTFSGPDPMSPATIASQIQSQSKGLLKASVLGSDLIIEALHAGATATLRVVGGDAAVLLGLPIIEPDSVAFGTNARIPIIGGIDTYQFTDPHGDPSYFYKVRFGNNGLNQVSEYSEPFSASDVSTVDRSFLATGFIDLVDMEGSPIEDVEVRVRMKSRTTMLAGVLVAGTMLADRTDSRGHVEFDLPRGAEVTVVISGTSIARDVTVPTDSTVGMFNLLGPEYGSDDAFNVQVPDLEYANRRSL